MKDILGSYGWEGSSVVPASGGVLLGYLVGSSVWRT